MKKLLLSSAVIAVGFTSFGQIFSASDSTDFAAFTKFDADGDGYNWDIVTVPTAAHASQGKVMRSESYINGTGALTPDNILVTPAINLTGVTSAKVTWKVGSYDAAFAAEKYSVYVVSNPNNVATATPIFTETLTSAAAAGTLNRQADISGMAGQSQVYIAFRHYDVTDEFVMFVDDIQVFNTAEVVENDPVSVGVYPNPAVTEINFSSTEEIQLIQVMNYDGKLVMTGTANKLNVSELTDGMYLYQATLANGRVAQGTFMKK